MYRTIIALVCVSVLVFSVHGLTESSFTAIEEYLITTEIRAINLTGYNGFITWEPINSREEARIVVEKRVRASSTTATKKFLNNITIENHSSTSEIALRAIEPRRPLGMKSSEVHFTVYASTEQIQDFKAQTSNGSITVNAEFRCPLNLRTSNGSITLRWGTGAVTLRTSNGKIDLGKTRLTDSSSVRTSNGYIEGTVAFPQHGEYLFESSNGRIDLRMPSDSMGVFDVKTSIGSVSFRLGQDVITRKKSIYLRRGDGPSIVIKTSIGNISVQEGDIN